MKFEEEIQKKIEAGNQPGNKDEVAYQHVFRALKKAAPSTSITPGLADSVMLRLAQRPASQRSWLEWVLAIFGGVSIIIGLVVTIVMTGFKLDFGFLAALKDYAGLFIFGIVFIILINILDRQLLRRKEFA